MPPYHPNWIDRSPTDKELGLTDRQLAARVEEARTKLHEEIMLAWNRGLTVDVEAVTPNWQIGYRVLPAGIKIRLSREIDPMPEQHGVRE